MRRQRSASSTPWCGATISSQPCSSASATQVGLQRLFWTPSRGGSRGVERRCLLLGYEVTEPGVRAAPVVEALDRWEQSSPGLVAGVVPAVALAAHRADHAVVPQAGPVAMSSAARELMPDVVGHHRQRRRSVPQGGSDLAAARGARSSPAPHRPDVGQVGRTRSGRREVALEQVGCDREGGPAARRPPEPAPSTGCQAHAAHRLNTRLRPIPEHGVRRARVGCRSGRHRLRA